MAHRHIQLFIIITMTNRIRALIVLWDSSVRLLILHRGSAGVRSFAVRVLGWWSVVPRLIIEVRTLTNRVAILLLI